MPKLTHHRIQVTYLNSIVMPDDPASDEEVESDGGESAANEDEEAENDSPLSDVS